MPWYLWFAVAIALMVAGAALFKHRQSLKQKAEAEAYVLKQDAQRAEDKAKTVIANDVRRASSYAKSKMP